MQHTSSTHQPLQRGSDIPAIALRNLCFAYEGERAVLENVNLTVPHGDFLALIGPNGGGKTTLLRLLLGMLEPGAGRVEIFGAAPSCANAHIGYVPQFSTIQRDFPASVLDMVLMGAARPDKRGARWPTDNKAREKAAAYLTLLGLENCISRPIADLSGGQRQRALVARALMSFPPTFPAQKSEKPADAPPCLLLLDEPTASIDPEGTFCFYEFLGKLRGSVTILVVSHDLFIVSPFFSRIAFVNKSLTVLAQNELSPESLTLLFGQHLHDCPVGDMQHKGKSLHHSGCSHPACSTACSTACPPIGSPIGSPGCSPGCSSGCSPGGSGPGSQTSSDTDVNTAEA